MTAEPLEYAGILVAAGAAAAALVAGEGRLRLAAIAVALVAAPVLVLGDVWDEPRVVDLRESPARIAAGVLVAGAIVAALVVLFRRRPEWFAIAAVAVLPLRVPLEIGGETANLLVPLYLVIGAGAIGTALARWRGGVLDESALAMRAANGSRPVLLLRWALAATVLLYAIQSAYSEDVSNAIENLGFFLVPFAILFCLLCEVPWTRRLLGRALIAAAAFAVAASVVGIAQWFARDLFLNRELLDANQLHQYFRVNSVFFDPNIFGRYLALVITALGAFLAWTDDRRTLALALAAAAVCLVALLLTYSITSFAALLAGLGVIALMRWTWRGAAAAAGLGLAALAALVVAGGTPTSDIQTDRNIDSGHFPLAKGGLILAGWLDDPDEIRCRCDPGKPVAGWGSGAFGKAFYDNIEPARTTISHSEPITVAAEQGAIGFLLYLALLAVALWVLLGGAAWRAPGRTAAAACFVTILVHSFGYTGFLIDPATWTILALGVACRAAAPASRTGPAAPVAA